MAVPKKKSSKSRRNMRRQQWVNRQASAATVSCPNCNEPKRPHTVCTCGHYDGRAVIRVRPAAEAAE